MDIQRVPEDLAEAYQWALEAGLGDGLPIIPPAPQRVERMVGKAGRNPGTVLGPIPPGGRPLTVQDVAANAVMAGCRPEYFPVVLAAAEAMLDSSFHLADVQASTQPCGPMVIVNGPIARELEIQYFNHCLGSGFRPNATIGRALRLILINAGEARPGDGDPSVFGWPGKIAFCWAENEDPALNPWEPLHVERGFKPEESTVTVAAVNAYHNCSGGGLHADDALNMFAYGLTNKTDHLMEHGEPIFVLGIEKVEMMRREGISKAEAKRRLFEKAQLPPSTLSDEFLAGSKRSQTGPQEPLTVTDKPEDITLAVAGGWGPHSVFLPTFPVSRSVTKKIESL